MRKNITRRQFINRSGLALAALTATSGLHLGNVFGATSERPYKIGICDWDLANTGNPASFALAKEFGFEGVEVSYQPEGDFSLSQPENRKLFLEEAKTNGMEISSLAMGVMNHHPLATCDYTESWIEDCIKALKEMEIQTVLLAFFDPEGIKENLDNRKKAVEKLKRLAPIAQAQGRTLGIESYCNAQEHLAMLEEIGNDNVKVYYDIQNMMTKEYSVYDDFELLLKEKALCPQLHTKEYGARLGEGKVDFIRYRKLLEKYDYQGWLIVETAVTGDWQESQKANAQFMKKTFLS